MENKLDLHYFYGVQKKCRDCTHYRRGFYKHCKLNYNMFLSSAFSYCQYNNWVPNQKLYDKYLKNPKDQDDN